MHSKAATVPQRHHIVCHGTTGAHSASQAEISDLEFTATVEQQICRLNVPTAHTKQSIDSLVDVMNSLQYVEAVYVLQASQHLQADTTEGRCWHGASGETEQLAQIEVAQIKH